MLGELLQGLKRLRKKAWILAVGLMTFRQGLNRLLKNSIFDRVLRETSLSG
jgi:hypothetical protein